MYEENAIAKNRDIVNILYMKMERDYDTHQIVNEEYNGKNKSQLSENKEV